MACKYTYNGVEYSKEQLTSKLSNENSNFQTLYNNLVNEITNTETGRKVLDRIKRDYVYKEDKLSEVFKGFLNRLEKYNADLSKTGNEQAIGIPTNYFEQLNIDGKTTFGEIKKLAEDYLENKAPKYSLEEQQEEAIVELLSLMTAEKLDAVKDGKLISLLKRLLKEMKQFVRSLLGQKEVEIDKLPDNLTINDLADLLAYSNSKLILPGNEVIYTTPDNMKFKTYAEASKHISDLAKNVKDVDLDNISLNKDDFINIPAFANIFERGSWKYRKKWDNTWGKKQEGDLDYSPISELEAKKAYHSIFTDKTIDNTVNQFIEKNKEYEQSKEIIEEWKKVNNIQYNPEEIYSRGQEFSSVVGAYSSFDVNLMMQNLLTHIEDNEKAGGKFAISAFTKPVDKNIGHLEGGGGKIKFKIYPKSEDILWAANTDVYSGSVWDASEKVNKDKKSELLGVSYTKYPALRNVDSVQPNLASIVDNLSHHHNELAISLNFNNFRLEYDEDIPYTTKKIIDSVNSILDQKYGKLIKPEIKKITTIPNSFEYWQQDMNEDGGVDRFRIQIYKKDNKWFEEFFDTYGQSESIREIPYKEVETQFNEALASNSTLTRNKGIQPTQTNETLKEKLTDVAFRIADLYEEEDTSGIGTSYLAPFGSPEFKQKEYTSQALINTKIAALKEAAKKYPRSLIRSEVKPIMNWQKSAHYDMFDIDELPFQKLSSKKDIEGFKELIEKENTYNNQFSDNEILNSIEFIEFNKNNLNTSIKDNLEYFKKCKL